MQPLVLVLDDLHCADRATLLLLEFLAAELRDARLLVVGTYRDLEAGLRTDLGDIFALLARHQWSQRLELEGLSEAEVGRCIEAMAAAAPPASTVAALYQRTEGNPLFVTELVRWLLAGGGLAAPTAPPGPLPLPPTVREVIAHRMRTPSTDCTAVLTVAAVVGREFGLPVVLGACALPPERVLAAVDEAVAARIVRANTQSVGTYRFAHVLLRDALYEGLGPGRRMQLHRDVGMVFEQLSAGASEMHLAALAHHFYQAAPAGEAARAADYSVRAAERASALLAYDEAVHHYELALQASSVGALGDARRCEILLGLADALRKAGQMVPARDICMQSIALARRLAVPELLGRAALRLGEPWGVWGVPDEDALRALEDAHHALGEEQSGLHARVMAGLALALAYSPAEERMGALVTHALEMARRAGDPHAALFVLFARHNLQWSSDPAERLAVATEILGVATDVGNREMVLRAHLWRRCDLEEIGSMAAADQELETCTRLTAELRHPRYEWLVTLGRGMRALLRGELAEAEQRIADAWQIGRRGTEGTVADEYLWMQLFVLRRAQGRLAELQGVVEAAVAKYPAYHGGRSVLGWRLQCRRQPQRGGPLPR